jgi:hypothetical protein
VSDSATIATEFGRRPHVAQPAGCGGGGLRKTDVLASRRELLSHETIRNVESQMIDRDRAT